MSPALAGGFLTTATLGKSQVVCFLMLSSMNSLYILDINPLSDLSFAKTDVKEHTTSVFF